ncbi:hypothetical protein CLI64_16340 [Nostoc sp. CENA543]|uniref:hypothetical protein n=1 Tax=Nostoc sp. CENA543 TaxID=1869241 RepID=UPI000CA34D87|nr:hypothetical protein [Nostoc sp. CENA543]AUT01827.1 hypothetical protein CLI64_16340 [Nostoc sp. CENA543]
MAFFKGLVLWVVIIFAEILHGTARKFLLEPWVGDFTARQITVFTGSLMILAIAFISIKWLGINDVMQLLAVGLLWLILTVGFELFLGKVVLAYSWERIFSDYNLLQGGLLPIGLFLLTLSPLAAAKMRHLV